MEKFKSLGFLISYIHRHSFMKAIDQLAPYGIGRGQLKFMRILHKKDGVSQEYIAEQLRMNKGTVARALQKLEQAGFIERRPSKEDRRVKEVYLTQKAYDTKKIFMKLIKKYTDDILDGFTDQERETALVLLTRMVENIERQNSVEKTTE